MTAQGNFKCHYQLGIQFQPSLGVAVQTETWVWLDLAYVLVPVNRFLISETILADYF